VIRAHRHVAPAWAPALACLALLGGAAALAGCPGTAAPTPYTPITGITIHVSELLGSLECGTGPGDVYKYSAVMWAAASDGGPLGAPLYSDAWDCFTDGVFENLPAVNGGSYQYFLKVYGYTYASVQGAAPYLWCPGAFGPDGGPCDLQDASFASALGAAAQWDSTCTATEVQGAPVTAACTALEPVVGGDAAAASGDASDAASGADSADAPVSTDAPNSADAGDSGSSSEAGDSGVPNEAAPDSPPEAAPDAPHDAPAE
jgi:hypothetical protein